MLIINKKTNIFVPPEIITMQQLKHAIKKVFFLVLLLMATSCFHRSKDRMNAVLEARDMDSLELFIEYKNTVFCLPSPQLLMSSMKNLKIDKPDSLTNPIQRVDNYTSSMQKSLNLGVYGTDLGYLNMRNNAQLFNSYLLVIDQLAADLNMNEVINSNTIEKINTHKNNPDSLELYISTLFAQADEYLKKNLRDQTSALIAVGGWVESLYIITSLYQKFKYDNLYKLILQQKYPLENVIKILAPYYRQSPEMAAIIDKLVDMAYDYDVIDMQYSYQNTPAKTVDGVITIGAQTSATTYPKSIEKIIRKIKTIRNEITK